MNPQLAPVFGRRSVRKYAPGDVPAQAVLDLLKAAMAAPSACAKDPWHFIVVRDAAMRTRIAAGLPNGGMLAHAPVGIVVCGDRTRAHRGMESESYLLQDCSAAIENLLIAAHALGLGACWLGVHPVPERIAHLREVLGIPENVLPVSVVALGLPGEHPPPRTRFHESAVHSGAW